MVFDPTFGGKYTGGQGQPYSASWNAGDWAAYNASMQPQGGPAAGGGGAGYNGPGTINDTAFTNAIPQALGYGNAAVQVGNDPQNALYDRTLGQYKDQVNADLASRGLSMSGAGAGIMGQDLNNFNIDWQNTQLGRMQQAQSIYSGYGGTAADFGRLTQGVAQSGFDNSGKLGQSMYRAPNNSFGGTDPSTSLFQSQQDFLNDPSTYAGTGPDTTTWTGGGQNYNQMMYGPNGFNLASPGASNDPSQSYTGEMYGPPAPQGQQYSGAMYGPPSSAYNPGLAMMDPNNPNAVYSGGY